MKKEKHVINENPKENAIYKNNIIILKSKLNISNLNEIKKRNQNISLEEKEINTNKNYKDKKESNNIEKKEETKNLTYSSIYMSNDSQSENLLNKKRRSQNSCDKGEDKINIMSINSIKIPENIEGEFIVNITSKLNNDIKLYTDDFNSSDEKINKKYLNRYIENIIFNNNKGRNIKRIIIFN